MEESVKQRIKQLMSAKGVTINQYSKLIGVPQTTLNKQVNLDTALSLSTVLAILDYEKGLSGDWLLRGEGNMLKTAESTFKYDLPEEEDCMGSFACTRPISPKVSALEDADRILANGKKKALDDANTILAEFGANGKLEAYIRHIVAQELQAKLMQMVG